MVSFIYFTDPSVIAVVQEIWTRIKQRYVDEYYSVDISQSKTTSRFAHHHYPPPHSPPAKHARPSASAVSDNSPTGSSSNQSIRSFSADDAFLTMRYAQQDMQDNMASSSSSSSPRQDMLDNSASPAVPVMASELKMLENYYRSRLKEDEKGVASHQRIPYLRRFTYPNINAPQRRHRPGKIYKVVEIRDDIQLRDLSSTQQQQDHEQHEAVPTICTCVLCYILKTGQDIRNGNDQHQRHGIDCYVRRVKRQWKKMGQPRRLPMHRISTADILHGSSRSPDDQSEIWRMKTGATGTIDEDQHDLSLVQTSTNPSGLTHVQSSRYVEPYDHPKMAKLIHWILVTVCRVRPRDQQDHIVELIELFPLKDGDMDLTAASRQQRMQNQRSLSASLSPEIRERQLQGSMKEDSSANRMSYLSQSSAGTSSSSEASTATSSLSDPHNMMAKTSKNKGKEPAKSRQKKHVSWDDNVREPHISNAELRPGKDMQRRPGEDNNHFLFTVTDDTGSQEHQEYLSPLRESSDHLSPPQRPGLLRRISGKSSPSKKDSPSSFFGMWSNGSFKDKHPQLQRIPSEAKLSLITPKPAKPINTSVLGTHSPETEVSSAAHSSTSNITTRIYPRSLRARPITQYSQNSRVPALLTVKSLERDGVALRRVSSALVQDFLNKHRLLAESETAYRRLSAREKHATAMQFVSKTGTGFSQGVTKVVYVSNWEHDDENRIKICKQSWSFDELTTKLMQPDDSTM